MNLIESPSVWSGRLHAGLCFCRISCSHLQLLLTAASLSEFSQWPRHILQWFLPELLPSSRPHAHAPAFTLFLSDHCVTNKARFALSDLFLIGPRTLIHYTCVFWMGTIKPLKHLKLKRVISALHRTAEIICGIRESISLFRLGFN